MNNLQIINGIMDPFFDANIFEYNVIVSSDVISLIFDYILDNDEASVTIYGNDFLTSGENHVILEVYDNELKTYNFKVLKEEDKTILQEDSTPITVEFSIKDDILNDIVAPGIAVICFLIIVSIYYLLFKRKKVVNKKKES